MSLIFLFIDGVGIGERNDKNPFYTHKYEFVEKLTNGQGLFKDYKEIVGEKLLFKGIDANLGVEGLPQSGTGQTTLFTGVNASELIGKHFGPYPHSGIKHLLKEESIFHSVKELGLAAQFVNAYPPPFFQSAEKRNRWSCTTLMTRSAGIPLYTEKDIENDRGITADIVQKGWNTYLDMGVKEISAEEGAIRLVNEAESYDLVLFEYYLTDKAGHSRDLNKAEQVLQVLNAFVTTVMNNMREEDTFLITSDHGNIEDLSVKTHTRNEVPLWVCGKGSNKFSEVKSILDVKEAIISLFSE